MLTRMSQVVFVLALILQANAFALDESSYQAKVANIYDAFKSGDYPESLSRLESLETALAAERGDSKRKAFVYYFKGIVLGKTYEFNQSIENFKVAIKLNHDAKDLYYEYAQVLYTDDRLEPARLAFKESIKRGFKRGVSLYYIAYISSLLGEDKRAVKFFNAVKRLPDAEKDEIEQSAEAQIAEIYLKKVLKKKDAVRKIQEYVLPQFEKALAVDKDSEQARQIRQRIYEIQKRYELILLKMRNGRPVYYPRHFVRFLQTIGSDSNVAYQADDVISASREEASSLYSDTSLFARYSFTVGNYLFMAPELSVGYKKHFSDEDTIKAFDGYNYSIALRNSLEHKMGSKPASFLFDISFGQSDRYDVTDEQFTLFQKTTTFAIGEKLELFDMGTTIFRLTTSQTERPEESDASTGLGFSLEQVIKISNDYSAFLYASYIKNTSDNDVFANTQMIGKLDFILPSFAQKYRPFLGVLAILTTPENDTSNRGTEKTIGPNLRLSRTLGSNTRLNLRYDYQTNVSGNENFEFTKSVFALDFEAVF